MSDQPDRSSANPRASEVDAEFVRVGDTNAEFMNGLPLLKPPFGHLVAIDLNRGAIKWRVPFGDMPSLRRHPALKGVTLPPVLGVAGAPGVLATGGGLVFAGGGDVAFHAVDAASGAEVWQSRAAAPRERHADDVSLGTADAVRRDCDWRGEDAALVAFALPDVGPARAGPRLTIIGLAIFTMAVAGPGFS